MLSTKLSHWFPHLVRTKGHGLYVDRRVETVLAGSDRYEATVLGSSAYSVALIFMDGELRVSCTCPYFQDRGACKHIWACILEADKKQVLSQARASRWLELVDDEATDYLYDEPPPPRSSIQQIPEWQEKLSLVRASESLETPVNRPWKRDAEISYELDLHQSIRAETPIVQLFYRTQKKNGEWSVAKELRIASSHVEEIPDPADQEILAYLVGSREYSYYGYETGSNSNSRALSRALAIRVLPLMAATGRLKLRTDGHASPLQWDEGAPWEFSMEIRRDPHDLWRVSGSLGRGEVKIPLNKCTLFFSSSLFLHELRLAPFRNAGSKSWMQHLRNSPGWRFKDSDRDAVLRNLVDAAPLPPVEADPEFQLEQRTAAPRFGLRLRVPAASAVEESPTATLLLDYGSGWIDTRTSSASLWLPDQRLLLRRDIAAEEKARDLLRDLGFKPVAAGATEFRVPPRQLPRVVRTLLAESWHVEAEGRAFRTPGEARLDVRSGIDWFELHGEVQYEGGAVSLPELLAAVRRGDTMVRLGDGTFGLLPEEWLERVAPLVNLGTEQDGHLRFRQNQAALLDALLAAQPAATFDHDFVRLTERFKRVKGVEPATQPKGFSGQLRDYQRYGVGWMNFLRDIGFGGCLADDMGVGKTAQVLALLEERRVAKAGPSLVVAPKSLMFNWKAEAERFTPKLKVLLHTGAERDAEKIQQSHLVLTTYGTLLRDVVQLAESTFDYVILDEAQAIKNASTASAKAVRLLKANHRLALSGTPVENHLGELWSLFEFLNPGMLGESRVLRAAGGLAQNPSEDARLMLAQALRPFILRRTKKQVAGELPEKTEQTIYCELEGEQRKQYDELKRHYRDKLLGKTDPRAWSRNRLQVLEALLRLRQAACHPGLIDERRRDASSAKLDTLLDQLVELREEGHKALVFSQFTSLLSIVQDRLQSAGIAYEYLDGKTRNREDHVRRFQEDPDCPVFLISLKAGGLGLNLTAAEYVFLLDPWWNPAVEAQAIDRAHRIGQTRNVFAYRLIARDTVEEKVLELQKSKRELADAILTEDNAVLRGLKPEDLALLLA